MPDKNAEHGKTKGVAIIGAAVVAGAAIVVAAAVVAKRPPPREDFLALAPEEKTRPAEPSARADEDEATSAEEEPEPAPLIARAEKLIADGSRDRGRIEGLLFGAMKARPGGEESTKAFKLLRELHEKWREEDSRPVPMERTGLPPPARITAPVPPPPSVVPPAVLTAGFAGLIGTDLSGWDRPTGGIWKVEGGAILADCLNTTGYLYTRKRYRNFTLKLKSTALATSEVHPHLRVRFRWVPEKGKHGCQVDVCGKAYFYGEMRDENPDEQVFDIPVAARPRAGSSIEVELIAVAEKVTMLLNGRETFSETTRVTEVGQIGLCAHRSSILFEKVEIKEH